MTRIALATCAFFVLSCGPRATPNEASHPPPLRIRITGRADFRDPRGPTLSWPGTIVSATVRGAHLEARFDEHAQQFGTSQYQAFIDGHETGAPIVLHAGEQTVVIADSLSPGPHRIDLVKRTEGSAGVTVFLGFSSVDLLEPPAPKSRRIEIVGDSNTAAYGVDGNGPLCHFTADTENFLHGYAWRVGEDLGADVTAIAYSGKGVLQNYDREDPLTLGKLYVLANSRDVSSVIDPAAYPADAVVVFAGGNDYAQPTAGKYDKPDDGAFVTAFAALLRAVRHAHPAAPIICLITPSIEDGFPPGYLARTSLEKNVRAAIAAVTTNGTAGDDRTIFLAPNEATKSEQTGCDFHPSPALQARIAVDLEAALRPLLAL